jgi:hypothetical protein
MKIRSFKIFALAAMLAAEGSIVPGWGSIRKDPAPASRRSRAGRKRLLPLGWNKRLCRSARQTEAPVLRRCSMGPAQVAPNIHSLWRLALMSL